MSDPINDHPDMQREPPPNVYRKLQRAREMLSQVKMNKSGHNKYAGYYYFELGDFLMPINDIFNRLGLCGCVSYTSDMATLTITNTDKPDEQIVFTSPMAEANLKGCHPIQNLGAVETYERRYLWVTALEIVEHDALEGSAPLDDAPAPRKASRPADKPAEVTKTAPPPADTADFHELAEIELETVLTAMSESLDIDALKAIYGPAWKKASKPQRDVLVNAYAAHKAKNNWQ